MRIIIAGSRDINSFEIVERAFLNSQPHPFDDISVIVSGCARGVDRIGEKIAEKYNIMVKRFPANWDKFGKTAGYKRNVEMAEFADGLIAVWDGSSRGTNHMIDVMNRENKPVYIELVY